MKILLAEDEINIAKGIATILETQEQYKCQFRFAENGIQALSISRTFHPDLVITDIRMFQMNGLDLIDSLKRDNLCKNFIIISGYSNFEYAQRAIRADVLDYLLKPIDKQHLIALVDKVWKNLPSNYAGQTASPPWKDPFFSLDLNRTEYPASLQKIISFMQKNYMKDISLQMLSEESMLHPGYISALINKHLKIHFNYLLDYIRLQKACELLATSDMTISEISYIVGYNNERRLYNAFQKRMSTTPGSFRKEGISRIL